MVSLMARDAVVLPMGPQRIVEREVAGDAGLGRRDAAVACR